MKQTSQKPRRLHLILAVLLSSLPFVQGQENSGRVLGVVADETGGLVPDAKIVATGPNLPKALETSTDSHGAYTLLNVPIGVYTIAVSKPGFATVRQENVQVT